jgi:hypothetical protein
MPEFILDHGTVEARVRLLLCDCFTQGYVEAMFFTDASDSDDGDLADATVHDLAPETWTKIKADCARFQEANAALLALAYDREDYSAEQAGRDYWFTRNGHGVGFWDREQLEADGLGDKLSDAARYSSQDLYRGDDGQIYLA